MADRGFGATLETALSAESAALGLLFYLNLVGGAIRFWTGVGDLTYSAQTYTGTGKAISIDKIADSIEKSDIGVELIVNYLDDTLRNEITTNDSVGRDATITLALINTATRAVTDGYQLFTGFVDRCEILDSGSTGQVSIRLASELAKLQRPRFFLLSNAHQQYLFASDVGMEFASHMDEPVMWGRKPLIPYVPGTPMTPPLIPPYQGYSDQFTFPISGYGPPGG